MDIDNAPMDVDALPLDITTPEHAPLPMVAQALLFGAPMPA
jgi:hypothetical protein